MEAMTSTGNMAATLNSLNAAAVTNSSTSGVLSTGASGPAPNTAAYAKRLMVADEGDCLATTRLDNQVLVDNLFRNFSANP